MVRAGRIDLACLYDIAPCRATDAGKLHLVRQHLFGPKMLALGRSVSINGCSRLSTSLLFILADYMPPTSRKMSGVFSEDVIVAGCMPLTSQQGMRRTARPVRS